MLKFGVLWSVLKGHLGRVAPAWFELSVASIFCKFQAFFSAKVDEDGFTRMYSSEYDGLYLDTHTTDHIFRNYVGNLPHALLLKNANQERFFLIPNYGLTRFAMNIWTHWGSN